MTSELTSPCSCAPHSETRVRTQARVRTLKKKKEKEKKKDNEMLHPSRPRGLFACFAGGGAEQDTLTVPTSHHPTRGRKSEDGWRGIAPTAGACKGGTDAVRWWQAVREKGEKMSFPFMSLRSRSLNGETNKSSEMFSVFFPTAENRSQG